MAQRGQRRLGGLTARRSLRLAYDPERNETVLFGGYDGLYLDDTWEYDGNVWTPGPQAPSGLAERCCYGMQYVETRHGILLFGGEEPVQTIVSDSWFLTCADIGPANLPAGQLGTLYSQALTAIGGTGPHTFRVEVGTLPPGISLDPAGTLDGTPTRTGTYQFVVGASDGSGCAGSQALTITIGPARDLIVGCGLGFPNPIGS